MRRTRPTAVRTAWLAGVVAATLSATACGGDDAATDTTTATSETTATTTPPTAPPSTTVDTTPGAVLSAPIDYVIAAGDFPSTIADRYQIPLQALLDENGWELVDRQVPAFPLPGSVIRIPAGATVPSATPPSTAPAGDGSTATATTAEPEDGVCGVYVIMEGDNPTVVARKLDTTVAKLDTVNADTEGYAGFILGLTINVPC